MPQRFLHLDLSVPGLLLLLAVLLTLALLVILWPLVLLLIIAAMFAAALLPVVEWLSHHHLPRVVAVLLLVLVLLVLLGLFGLLVGPVIVRQARVVADRLPELRHTVAQFLDEQGAHDAGQRVESFTPGQLSGSIQLASAGRLALSGITAAVTCVVLTAYLLFDAPRILQFIDFATPARYRVHVHRILAALRQVVGGYLLGQLVTSVSVTVVAFLLFTVLGIPNAVALAVLAGVTDVIPIIGVYLFVIPGVLAALSKSPLDAVIVGVVLVAYQEFESRLLVQRIYGQTLRLPAVVVVIALLVGAALLGVIGALLALPAAATIRVFVEYGNEVRQAQAAEPEANR